ncbi:MAG: ATP-binding cassette domain-containing protein [Clostridium sp.]
MNSKNTTFIREYILKHIPHIIFILIISFLLSFFRVYGTAYIEYLTEAIELKKMDILRNLIFTACFFQAMFYFLRWIVAVTAARFDEQVAFNIRIRLLHHVNHISLVDYEGLNAGNIQSIIRIDSQKASKYMYIVFSRILPNIFILLFSYIYMSTIDNKGTIFIVFINLFLGFVNFQINKKIKHYEFESRKIVGVISGIILKVCEAFDTIKVYQASNYILNQYSKKREEFNKVVLKSTAIKAGNDMILSLVNNVTLFVTSIILAFKAIKGDSSIGEVLAYISLLAQSSICVTTILTWMSSLANAKASMERINSLFSIRLSEENYNNTYNINNVKISKVNYSYNDRTKIIRDLNLNLDKGNIYQIIGESGSGKTTLIKILMGFYECEEMEILINNSNKIASLQRLIGYVPANPNLFNASIFDNIALGDKNITHEKCYSLAREIGIDTWLESLPKGLTHVVDKNASNISGGQKQAIAILRVLVSNYPIIIMDEPFSALDKQKEVNLSNILSKIKKNKIVIFTSHRECIKTSKIIKI